MSSPTARAADNKREEFRRYLERKGVMDVLTRAMVCLYEEPDKPDDPIRYICNILGHSVQEQPTIDALRSELEETKLEVRNLREEFARSNRLHVAQSVEETGAGMAAVTLSDTAPSTCSAGANGIYTVADHSTSF